MEGPQGVPDTPPHPIALPRCRTTATCLLSTAPTEVPNFPPCQQPKSHPSCKQWRDHGQAALAAERPPRAPRQRPGPIHPQGRGSGGPADLEQLCPAKIQPRAILQPPPTSLIETTLLGAELMTPCLCLLLRGLSKPRPAAEVGQARAGCCTRFYQDRRCRTRAAAGGGSLRCHNLPVDLRSQLDVSPRSVTASTHVRSAQFCRGHATDEILNI